MLFLIQLSFCTFSIWGYFSLSCRLENICSAGTALSYSLVSLCRREQPAAPQLSLCSLSPSCCVQPCREVVGRRLRLPDGRADHSWAAAKCSAQSQDSCRPLSLCSHLEIINFHHDSFFTNAMCVSTATNCSEVCCKVLRQNASLGSLGLLFFFFANIRLQLPVLSLTWTICKVNESPFFIFVSLFVTNVCR